MIYVKDVNIILWKKKIVKNIILFFIFKNYFVVKGIRIVYNDVFLRIFYDLFLIEFCFDLWDLLMW